jgi:hypothetical protein
MSNDEPKLTIFVSSMIGPLWDERVIVEEAIETGIPLARTWVFERAPASSKEITESYLVRVRECDIYLLILGQDISNPVKAEYQTAVEYDKPRLCFVQEGVERTLVLEEFLPTLQANVKYATFSDEEDLRREVLRAVRQELVEGYKRYRLGEAERAQLVASTAASAGSKDGTPSPSYLPPKAYHRLVGRFGELDKIMSALRDPKRKPVIAVVGLGGIGKTALAREAVERCGQEKLFDYIVWASSKTERFVSEGIIKTGISAYGFDELLSDIGRQCDRVDIAQMPAGQKQAAAKHLLATKRVLVVMDNLETIPESEELVASVFQILGQSKLLITSRHHVKHERVFTLDLGGFPEDEGVTFLREESKERGIEAVVQASRDNLVEIHQVTGGAPLAMKLVVGQMSRQPMGVVLNVLRRASFKGQDYPFYRFVYQYSWGVLDMNARMALVDMSVFPPITGGAVDDVQAVSQVENPNAFWLAMDQLVAMSLVDKIGPAGQERLALHPLTQYFVRSDITKEWAADE